MPVTPWPVIDSKSVTLDKREIPLARAADDRRSQRMLADVFEARRQAQQIVALSRPAAGSTATSLGLPSVSVPVLSTTMVVTFSSISSASAFRISTPASAPRPVPTMIDIGVARPSAHGHAMISTATAFTSA